MSDINSAIQEYENLVSKIIGGEIIEDATGGSYDNLKEILKGDSDFKGPKGDRGPKGDKGDKGEPGQNGKDGQTEAIKNQNGGSTIKLWLGKEKDHEKIIVADSNTVYFILEED